MSGVSNLKCVEIYGGYRIPAVNVLDVEEVVWIASCSLVGIGNIDFATNIQTEIEVAESHEDLHELVVGLA